MRVENFEQLKNAGDFLWQAGRLMFRCPCGCGIVAGVSVKPIEPHGWEWNGDLDRPTITPSILIDRGHWHGYLTAGEFKAC